MSVFEIIFTISFALGFLGLAFYVVFVFKPKEIEKPPFELPKEFTIRVLHETILPEQSIKGLNEEDQKYLKEQQKKRDEEVVKEYLDLNETVNDLLDNYTGDNKKQ